MQEAVELVETVEETGKIYAYGENYCFMPAPMEMKKRYRQGTHSGYLNAALSQGAKSR